MRILKLGSSRRPLWRLHISAGAEYIAFTCTAGGYLFDTQKQIPLRITAIGLTDTLTFATLSFRQQLVRGDLQLAMSPRDNKLACCYDEGLWIATLDGKVVQDTRYGPWERKMPIWLGFHQFTYSADGEEIWGVRDGIWRWRTDTFELIPPTTTPTWTHTFAVATGGRTAAIFESGMHQSQQFGHTIRFREIPTSRDIGVASIRGGDFTGSETSSFTRDGRYFAWFYRSRLWVWETSSGKTLLHQHGGMHYAAVVFTPDARWLIAARGEQIERYCTSTWKLAALNAWEIGRITCVAVAPDGFTAAAGGSTGSVVVWDLDD